MKKLLRSKKATESGAGLELPHQAFIEVFVISVVIIAFLSYAVFIINDYRIYQTFLSKDISLFQDSIILPQSNINGIYLAPEKANLEAFYYEMMPLHTSVIYTEEAYSDDAPPDKEKAVVKRYIHMGLPKGMSFKGDEGFANPERQIYFSKFNDVYSIGKSSDILINRGEDIKECFDVSFHNTYFFIDMGDKIRDKYDIFIQTADNKNKFSFVKKGVDNQAYVKIRENKGPLQIIVPFDDEKASLGCKLYNELNVQGIAVNMIKAGYFQHDYKFEVLIKTPVGVADDVFDALEEIS